MIRLKTKTKNKIMMGLTAASMTMAGYMYMKRNPKMINDMKEMAKNMTKSTYNKIEEMN